MIIRRPSLWLPKAPAIIKDLYRDERGTMLLPGIGTGIGIFLASQSGVASGPTLEWLDGRTSNAQVLNINFNTFNLGTATADRYIIVGVMNGRNPATPNNPTVTLGGNAMSLIGSVAGVTFGKVSLWGLLVTSGTSATLNVATSNTGNMWIVSGYSLKNYVSSTPHATANSNTDSTTLDIPAGGVAIGFAGSHNGSVDMSWSGLSTEDYQTTSSFTTTITASSASQTGMSSETGRAISCASSNSNEFIVAASWV